MEGEQKVLVVDDQPSITGFIVQGVKKRFPRVKATGLYDGYEALTWISENIPDLVVTDLRLPHYGGLEIIMNTISKAPQTPVFVMSAAVLLDEVKGLVGGMESLRFFPKPFQLEEMLDEMESFLAGKPDSVIQGIGAISLIQIIKLEEKSCRLDFSYGSEKARLHFRNGELRSATAGEKRGREAFFYVLGQPDPKISVYYDSNPGTTNIDEPMESLLLNFCEQQDKG